MKVGDQVLATDPETGETGAREAIATLPHTDQLLTLRLSSGAVVTTEDHRYWNATDQAWQESQHLDAGDRLLSADGDVVTVEGLDWATVHTDDAYDLTIDGLHTFYVGAGDEAVLVHNCGDYLINRAFKAPNQVTPGTRTLRGEYINDIGPGGVRVEPWTAHYDEYGRLVARTDYNASNAAAGIPGTHHSIYTYGPGCTPCIQNHIPGEFIP